METAFAIVIVSALVTAAGLAALIGREGRASLYKLLGQRFGWWKPPPEPTVVSPLPPPVPAPPPRPDIKYGNIAAIPAEQEQAPDLSLVYEFPEKAPPTLRFADLNTRLLIVFRSNGGVRRVYPEKISDEPAFYGGTQAFFDHLVRKQLRPAYPTILDPGGLFTAYSALLEREPFARYPLIDAYLAIPIERRPVVVSVPLPERKETKTLVFCRYGFEDFHLNLDFLGPNWPTSLRHLFGAFLGTPLEWSNFSHARLRHLATIDDENLSHTANALAAAIDEAEQRQRETEELALDRMEGFTEVFRRTPTQPAVSSANGSGA